MPLELHVCHVMEAIAQAQIADTFAIDLKGCKPGGRKLTIMCRLVHLWY